MIMKGIIMQDIAMPNPKALGRNVKRKIMWYQKNFVVPYDIN
jgi:hypothetical protein